MGLRIAEVKDAARGRWEDVCRLLAPKLEDALNDVGRHCACPVHGGHDGFRLFSDFNETGGGVCATCGAKPDGLALISWVNGWTLPQTIAAVGHALGLSDDAPHSPRRRSDPVRRPFQTTGLIEASGSAPYKFEDANYESPYVRLRILTPKGPRTTVLWGRDLARAISAARVGVGNWVEIMRLGGEQVTLPGGRSVEKGIWSVKRVEPPQGADKISRGDFSKYATDNDRRKAARILDAWAKSVPISTSDEAAAPIVRYLKTRRIYLGKTVLEIGDSLRAGPPAPFYDESNQFVGTFPTLTAAVRAPDDEGTLVTLHRTYLTPDGRKILAASPKRLMGLPAGRTIKGAAVRIGRPKMVLAVAEGIETALSVVAALNIPCWAALSANGLEAFEPPKNVRIVLIMADLDRSGAGLNAARSLRRRLIRRGLNALILLPPGEVPDGVKGIDWNDVWLRQGADGFPRLV